MYPLPVATGVRRPTGRRALSRVIAHAAEAARASKRGHLSYIRVRREPPEAATARFGLCVTELHDSGSAKLGRIHADFRRFDGDPDLIAAVEPELAHRRRRHLGHDRGKI